MTKPERMTKVPPDKKFREWVDSQFREMKADEDLLHNKDLHRRILSDWKANRTEMYRDLQRQLLTEKLAFVLQEQMWRESDSLQKGGMPLTDAQEQAEANWLMLGPDQSEEEVYSI
jgi:hypothetical protein